MVARRSGLGKGLGALIPSDVTETDSALREIPLSQIEPNKYQPRGTFDEESLVSLTASVRELGVLQPVLVRQVEERRYELIAGERRWRAAKRAGLPTIPALVKQADDVASLEQALVENLHRADLNPIEEAAAYQQLIDEFDLTQEQVATRVGKSRPTVANALRLFQLPPSIQKLLIEGRLSGGHARALLGTPDRAFQEALAARAADGGMTVREVEEAVRTRTELDEDVAPAPEPEPTGGRRLRPPGLLELEELLSEHLDTRVRVSMGAKRGKVVVEFATLEDLERIYRAMTEPPEDRDD
ncbi:ParB/RepB/Spo0J family partition protein [Actinomarinicola tropica]|uniref:ParB/RepB/Spo0J family partition protein n=1 Tax=Actinomarinicola tropica TaxID=2789776 RepID=A0A5Q2RUJ6_9ACTN|nr:ParB/RepB/Spo0J family partition protein [Actinomarinicola tropica]